MRFLFSALAASSLVANVMAHPGHDDSQEAAERAAFTKLSKKDLSHCSEQIKARGLEQRAVARREASVKKARQKRGLPDSAPQLRRRADPLTIDHQSSVDYKSDAAASDLFTSNSSCILSPEVTEGPYWIAGEYVREDNSEDQPGMTLTLDTQVLDMETCEPVTNAVIEIWACNATGVYSGVVVNGNGVGLADPGNLDKTFLRGLQPTDEDGVAQFTTIFPGHYSGRATHMHVMVHFNGTKFDNGTYAGGYISHVGQLFFDQSLITEVETLPAYKLNTQALTLNEKDRYIAIEKANGHDPFVSYSLLSDNIEDGVFSWIAFGVNLTTHNVFDPAATLTEEGGVVNPNGGSATSRIALSPSASSNSSSSAGASSTAGSSSSSTSASASTSASSGAAASTFGFSGVFNSGLISTALLVLREFVGLL